MEKQKRTRKTKNKILEFPQHIVELIFSKLPFYNLPTCRIVCKTWNHIVSNCASSFKFLPNAFFINTYDVSCSCFQNSKLHCIDYDTISSVARFYVHLPLSHILIMNSCNGLLHVRSTNEIQHNNTGVANFGILNPMTNEFLYLYELPRFLYDFGFGFSPKTKRYKLFRIFHVYKEKISIIEVVRFGIVKEFNNWKHLDSQLFAFKIHNHGVYLNGVVYWIGNNIANEYAIYGLDVETETFETIVVLDIFPASWFSCYYAKLQLFNGSIYAIIQVPLSSSKIEVWSMRDKHSWIKEFVHMLPDDVSYPRFHLVKAVEDRISFLVNDDLFCFHKTERKITKIYTNPIFDPWDKRIVSVLHMQSFQFGYVQNILEGKDPFTSNE